jgi:centromeric protein E
MESDLAIEGNFCIRQAYKLRIIAIVLSIECVTILLTSYPIPIRCYQRRSETPPSRYSTFQPRTEWCSVLVCLVESSRIWPISAERSLSSGVHYPPVLTEAILAWKQYGREMASPSALPQPSRLTTSTPTGSASTLPSAKLKTLSSDTQRVPSPTPSKLRPPASPRPSLGGTTQSNSASSIATLRSTSVALTPNGPEKSLRRTVSIAAFPQPPKSNARLSTASSISSSASHLPSAKRSSPDLVKPVSSAGSVKVRKQSRVSASTTGSYRNSKTPSLLNNSGEGKSILNGFGTRDSEGQFSIPSPTQSRSSSAQGSYSTSATTFDDTEDAERHGLDGGEPAGSVKKTARPKEAKGNVIVSVRVRPDTGAADGCRTEGEWMVDGRRSLIAFKGKESYDYLYGKCR